MMKDRPINIQKLEKLCSSHLTKTKIDKINEVYIIEIINRAGFNKKIIIEQEIGTYKYLLNTIMKIKKEIK